MEAVKTMKKPALVAAGILGLLFSCYLHSASASSGGVMGGDLFSFSSSSSSSSSSSYSSSNSEEFSSLSSSLSGHSYSTTEEYQRNTTVPPVSYSDLHINGQFLVIMILVIFFMIIICNLIENRSKRRDLSIVKLQIGLLGVARSLQRHLDLIAVMTDTSTPEGLSYILKETTRALLQHEDCGSISGYSSGDVKQSIEDGQQCFNLLSFEERAKFDEETLVNVDNIKRRSTRSQRTANSFRNGYIAINVKESIEDGEQCFGKLDDETLVNWRDTKFQKDALSSNEYIVITILVAAKGVHKLPAINSSTDLKAALQKLHPIPSKKLMVVKVLWTPQVENDTLSDWELLENYPLLKTLRG